VQWAPATGTSARHARESERSAGLRELAVPPGNHLEPLHGNRSGQYSIRINEQYRLYLRWEDGHADEVEVTDYH
jgi:proteic killer suppression protein